jgi:hypothetical protein
MIQEEKKCAREKKSKTSFKCQKPLPQYTGNENCLGGRKKKIAHNSTTASAAFLAFLL